MQSEFTVNDVNFFEPFGLRKEEKRNTNNRKLVRGVCAEGTHLTQKAQNTSDVFKKKCVYHSTLFLFLSLSISSSSKLNKRYFFWGIFVGEFCIFFLEIQNQSEHQLKVLLLFSPLAWEWGRRVLAKFNSYTGEIRVPATTIFTKNHKKSQQITQNHTK